VSKRPADRPADEHGDWVLWRPEDYGSPLFLSPVVAQKLEEERLQRRAELHAEQLADALKERRQAEAAAAIAAKATAQSSVLTSPTVGPHRAHEHEVRRHRVLPDDHLLVRRLDALRSGMLGDKDHTGRELQAITAALTRGTKRSIVRPLKWRAALDGLATECPAFSDAIDIYASAHQVSEVTSKPPSIPPILLVGPPGVGKSHFCRRVAETLECGSKWLAMDQPTAGSDLRGSDKHWSTARHGVLFELLALGDTANPLVVLDEIDKAARRQSSREIDPLAQLYSVLERETARRIVDVSLDIELDASLVTYIATANSLTTLDTALLSRFEVIAVGLPSPDKRRESARRIIECTVERLGLWDSVRVSPGVTVLLADYSPRLIQRVVEKAVGTAIATGRERVDAEDVERELGLVKRPTPRRLH
jgi:ATP-dependent Lon protease